MPITDIAPPVLPMPPTDVQDYLFNRNWYTISISTGEQMWAHSNPDLHGQYFQWPEALAYEIFKNFVILKTAGE